MLAEQQKVRFSVQPRERADSKTMKVLVTRNEQRPSRSPLNFGDGDLADTVGSNGASSLDSPPFLRASEAESTGKQVSHHWQSSSWIVSFLTHLLLLISLSLFAVTVPSVDKMVMQIPLPIGESVLNEELETFQILEPNELDVEPMVDVAETDDVTFAIDTDPLVTLMAPDEMPTMVEPIESLAMILSAPSPPARLLPVKLAVQRDAGGDVGGEPGQAGSTGKPGTGIEGDLGMAPPGGWSFPRPRWTTRSTRD